MQLPGDTLLIDNKPDIVPDFVPNNLIVQKKILRPRTQAEVMKANTNKMPDKKGKKPFNEHPSFEEDIVIEVMRKNINHILIMGDSLTDRGTFSKRTLLGLPIMGKLAGLAGRTPFGRFTNGYTWADHLAWDLAQIFFTEYLIDKYKEDRDAVINELDNEEGKDYPLLKALVAKEMGPIASTDDKVCNEWWQHRILELIAPLKDDTNVSINGVGFFSTYAEGGLMAAPHMEWILSNLEKQFYRIKNDDRELAKTQDEKNSTLVIEWSGANDLVTATSVPEMENVPEAISAKEANVIRLIEQGYTNIILCNLPDLSLTPRFQRKSKAEQQQAQDVTLAFNKQLQALAEKIGKKHNVTIQVVDAYSEFNEVYNAPEKYGFSRKRRDQTYSESKYYKKPDSDSDVIPASHKFMFDDDLHPSNRFHELLAEKFLKMIIDPNSKNALKKQFIVTPPAKVRPVMSYDELFDLYKKDNPDTKLDSIQDKKGFIHQLLNTALYDGNEKIRQQLVDLRWINNQGKINPNYSSLTALYIPASQMTFFKSRPTLAYSRSEVALAIFTLGYYCMLRESVQPILLQSPIAEAAPMQSYDYGNIVACTAIQLLTLGLAGLIYMGIEAISRLTQPDVAASEVDESDRLLDITVN